MSAPLVPRPARVLAIARQDWATELKGRQGLLLPVVIAGLLLPASLLPSPTERFTTRYTDPTVSVSGEVPAEVLALPVVVAGAPNHLHFERGPSGALLVHGERVPEAVRDALDAGRPVVRVEILERPFRFPGRTMLLSLITASTLTGAVSSSIGGERSRRTLVILLAAAVTRTEIVLGKWTAWSVVGAGSALLAALIAVAFGPVELGWWLVALPTVPLATVALGLYLVRRASDVVAGTATTLRVLPVALSMTGIVAWLLGDWGSPWLGALVPLGGALIAAGDTWDGPGPALLAAATTLTVAAAWLVLTVRDVEEVSDRDPPETANLFAAAFGALAAACWWMPMCLPVLWAAAGNPRIIEALPISSGVVAGAACFGAATLVRVGRSTLGPATELGLRPVPLAGWLAAVVAGATLALVGAASWQPSLPEGQLLAAAQQRMAEGLQPALFGVALVAIVAEELVFRGWFARVVGPARASLVWAIVKAPLDPIGGLLAAGALGSVGALGGPFAAILARVVWWLAAGLLPTLSIGAARTIEVAGVAALIAAALWLSSAGRPRS